MGRARLAAGLIVALGLGASASAEDDLEKQAAGCQPTPGLRAAEDVRFGRCLFHSRTAFGQDPQGPFANCATCHYGRDFTDRGTHLVQITNAAGETVQVLRRTPSLLNAAINFPYTWDGRAATLQDAARGAILSPVEMNGRSVTDEQLDALAAFMLSLSPPERPLPFPLPLALPSNVGTTRLEVAPAQGPAETGRPGLLPPEAPLFNCRPFPGPLPLEPGLDPGTARAEVAPTQPAPGPSAPGLRPLPVPPPCPPIGEHILRGQRIFLGKGACATCHTPPTLTNNTITTNQVQANFSGKTDRGAGFVGTGPEGHFKVPSLRALDTARPFMHNGALAKLDQVVRFYNRSLNLNLTPREVEDLIAYLRTL